MAAAVAAGRVFELAVDRSRSTDPDVAALAAAVEEGGGTVRVVADLSAMASTEVPQGVVAHARPIPLASLEEAAAASDPPALIVLDHLEDPRNVGAITRSAAAAGVGGLVVATRRAAPLSPAAFKAAAGAFESLSVVAVSSIAEGLARLGDMGIWRVGLEPGGSQSLFGLELLTEPVALVIGAEGKGLSRLVAERCDVLAAVPQTGTVESLNASVAAALAMYELSRMRGWVT